MTIPTHITLDLDFTPILVTPDGRGVGPDGEGTRQTTFEELIIEAAARRLAEMAKDSAEGWEPLYKEARKVMALLVEQRVAEALADFFARPITPTNRFGESTGEPTTFAETVEKMVKDALTKTHNGDPYDRKAIGGTVVQQAIHAEIEKTVKAEVKAAVTAEREAIVAQVAASTAAVLTEGMKRAVML